MSEEKLVGEGLQYFVYSNGPDRVRKVPKTREEMRDHLEDWYDSEERREENLEKALKRRKIAVKELKNRSEPLNSVFGNLEFKEDISYQDKATVAEDILESEDLERGKQIVDDYIELVKEMWRFGIGDTIYNFTINTGYNSQGHMFQLDFGEVVFSKEKVREEIENEKWLEQWTYNRHLSPELKDYFRKRMSEELGIKLLDKVWGVKE